MSETGGLLGIPRLGPTCASLDDKRFLSLMSSAVCGEFPPYVQPHSEEGKQYQEQHHHKPKKLGHSQVL